jgi:predicted MPP superfamily phosphohydrolase
VIRRRSLLLAFLLTALLGIAAIAWCYGVAVQAPTVRTARMDLAEWPAGAPRLRAVLISDIHVIGPDMPPERLERIVRQINALRPDLVLIAGDLISEKRASTRHYSMADAIRPLGALDAPLGRFAVLGNHDHWYDPEGAKAALAAAGVRLLENDAVQAGPLAVGGIDDDFTGHDDLPRAVARLRTLDGAKILLSHSPDPFPELPADIGLMLAGHTHCGQIAPPLIGPLSTMSRHGKRYACGMIREAGKTLIVTAGLGTSGVPLRLGAVPDMWLLDLGPRQ